MCESRDSPSSDADRYIGLVYDELRRLARARLAGERSGHTLQTTALVHEAYARLAGSGTTEVRWDSTAHFFGAASEAMRRILIDHARARNAEKRGGGAVRLPLDPGGISLDDVPHELLDLDEALRAFEAKEPDIAMLVKLRVFGGLTQKQAADAIGVSISTADRYWAYARAWLYEAMTRGDEKT